MWGFFVFQGHNAHRCVLAVGGVHDLVCTGLICISTVGRKVTSIIFSLELICGVAYGSLGAFDVWVKDRIRIPSP